MFLKAGQFYTLSLVKAGNEAHLCFRHAEEDETKLGCLGKGMGLRKYLESENAGREMKILETRRRDTVGEASLLK